MSSCRGAFRARRWLLLLLWAGQKHERRSNSHPIGQAAKCDNQDNQGAANMNGTDIYSESGDWIADTVRRKPEAILLLVAGCALLLRGGGGSSSARSTGPNH